MATNLDIIRSALQAIGVLPEGQEPSAEQADHAFTVMNDFLEDWSASEIEVGQWPQTQLDAAFPAGGEVVQTAKAYLAVLLAPFYERPVHPVTAATADKGYSRLLRNAMVAQIRPADTSGLPTGEANRSSASILTDE